MYTNKPLGKQIRDYDDTFNAVELLLKEFFPKYYEEKYLQSTKQLERVNS